MTVTLNFNPELEAWLLAQAKASGVSVEAYVRSVVERALLPAMRATAPGEERAAAFEAWAAGHRSTPPLSGYAVSRESFYEGPDH
jgi:hypothetical protein